MTASHRSLLLVMLISAAAACTDSTRAASPFTGRWAGSNASFTAVTIDAQQLGDSLTGTGDVTLANGGHDGPRPFVGHIHGDSVSLSWLVPPSVGYALMRFDGRRYWGSLAGTFNGTSITLARR